MNPHDDAVRGHRGAEVHRERGEQPESFRPDVSVGTVDGSKRSPAVTVTDAEAPPETVWLVGGTIVVTTSEIKSVRVLKARYLPGV